MKLVNKRTSDAVDNFEKILDFQVELLKVLANRTRLKIIYLLNDSDELAVSDLRKMLGITKANLSQQIAILRNSGIVRTRSEGRNVFVSIEFRDLLSACKLVREVIREKMLKQAEPFLEGER